MYNEKTCERPWRKLSSKNAGTLQQGTRRSTYLLPKEHLRVVCNGPNELQLQKLGCQLQLVSLGLFRQPAKDI
jgi:hypothetical protein